MKQKTFYFFTIFIIFGAQISHLHGATPNLNPLKSFVLEPDLIHLVRREIFNIRQRTRWLIWACDQSNDQANPEIEVPIYERFRPYHIPRLDKYLCTDQFLKRFESKTQSEKDQFIRDLIEIDFSDEGTRPGQGS